MTSLLNSQYGGTWNAQDGGEQYYVSGDQSFAMGAIQAGQDGWWGSPGAPSSFDQALYNYNGGTITSGMAATLFSVTWGSTGQATDVSAEDLNGGFNISGTATSDGGAITDYFVSDDFVRGAFENFGGSEPYETPEGLEVLNHIDDGIGGMGTGLGYSSSTFRLMNGYEVSPKIYTLGWGGGSPARITTYEVSGLGEGLAHGAIAATVILGAIDIYGAMQADDGGFGANAQLATGRTAGGLFGGYIGAEGGAAAGAAIGVWFGGVGAVPGAIIGGIIGGILGGWSGSATGEAVTRGLQ